MKRLLVVNPNRSAWMTERVLRHAAPLLAAGWQLQGLTAADGPEVIDNRESFDAGASAAQALLRDAPPHEAVLLACFGDPGFEALRAAGCRVAGLAQAAMDATAGRRYAILTCGTDWVPLLQQRAATFGHAAALAGVWALPVNGVGYAADPTRWQPALQAAADEAVACGAQVVIPGGAVFAGVSPRLHGPALIIDAVAAALEKIGALDVDRAVARASTG